MSQDKTIAAVSQMKRAAEITDLIKSIDGTFEAICTNSSIEALKYELMQHSSNLRILKDFLTTIQD